tara:strand:- start:670 stop:975 length:306 start_codon:yes stop_codon:yes gene_type:complete
MTENMREEANMLAEWVLEDLPNETREHIRIDNDGKRTWNTTWFDFSSFVKNDLCRKLNTGITIDGQNRPASAIASYHQVMLDDNGLQSVQFEFAVYEEILR